MCSVIGHIGSQSSKKPVLHGLLQLEYRGYDSAGYATLLPDNALVTITKVVGSVAALESALSAQPGGHIGIGHTRWSTHGIPSKDNAHPHTDCSGTFALVHNGIIENSSMLRTMLSERGHSLISDTDSELIVHLLEDAFSEYRDYSDALRAVASQLMGAYACLIITPRFPDLILWLRSRSPLCVTHMSAGTSIASDPVAFLDGGSPVCYIPDQTVGIITIDNLEIITQEGVQIQPEWHLRTAPTAHAEDTKSAAPHRMLSEIFEQKMVVGTTLRALAHADIAKALTSLTRHTTAITLIGCGTSYHAALIGKSFLETITDIPTTVALASEYLYAPFLARADELCIGISQSGETADTIEALRLAKEHGIPTLALTNTQQSTVAREADYALYTQAGVERAVASTKAFTTQVATFFFVSSVMALVRNRITSDAHQTALAALNQAAVLLEEAINQNKHAIDTVLAPRYAQASRAIFLGRQVGYALACEAALKLAEISYIFTHAYPAGELKHGPLALIESGLPIFLISSQDPIVYRKLVSNAHEVKARGGHLCIFASEDQTELIALADSVIVIPRTSELLMPIAVIGVVQYLCYAIALHLGRPIDKPRNLAKSVTVE